MLTDKLQSNAWDERRDLIIPGNYDTSVMFCIQHFTALAKKAIRDHGSFFVALSGGSTPKAIFEHLTVRPHLTDEEWAKVHLFWSDERAVAHNNPDSNYKMAMDSGLAKMPIPKNQIHRMHAEDNIQANALEYEKAIQKTLNDRPFDLVMLGMGDDGHTASLFPFTEGLHVKDRLVIANYLPEKKVWRMTLTFDCINNARNIAVYVLGAPKKFMLSEVLLSPDQFERLPSQRIGTKQHRALWIADDAAASDLIEKMKKRGH